MRLRSLLIALIVVAFAMLVPATRAPAVSAGAGAPPSLPDVRAFGDAKFALSTTNVTGNQPIVGVAGTPSGKGYWEVAIDGGVFTFGDAHFYGSMGGAHLNQPVVGIAATPTGHGYWLVANDGGVFSFGDAHFYGSMGGTPLNQPVVGIASTRTGKGYWLAAADGGVFTFGDAHFAGSMGAKHLPQPFIGIAAPPNGPGYLIATVDGRVFPFGGERAPSGESHAGAPIVGIAPHATNDGYWLVDANGQVFQHGCCAPRLTGALHSDISRPIVGIASTRSGKGYWIVGRGTAPAYFLRGEKLGAATRDVHTGSGVSTLTNLLRDLVAGPNAAERAAGLTTAIPAGTRVNKVTVSGNTATIDLSAQFVSGGGSLSIQERVAQVVFTLTEAPEITRVSFSIDGKHVTTIGGEGLIVDPPVGRDGFESFLPQVVVVTPAPGDLVSSPLVITGRINSFEGTGTFELRAADGRLLASGFATGQMGAWRKVATALSFEPGIAATGTLTARPSSGLEGVPPADAVIPVRFHN